MPIIESATESIMIAVLGKKLEEIRNFDPFSAIYYQRLLRGLVLKFKFLCYLFTYGSPVGSEVFEPNTLGIHPIMTLFDHKGSYSLLYRQPLIN
jgi:hypothetical protein